MEKLKELRAKAEELIAKMRTLLDTADTETRDLTPEETTQYAAFEKEADTVQRDIDRLERLEEREAQARAKDDKPYRVSFRKAPSDKPKEFRDLGEFIISAVCNRDDPRLRDYYRQIEVRDQSMGTGTEGGFAVPEQFMPGLTSVSPQEAIFATSRINEIPAGDPPDAKFTHATLDQTSAQNVYGGVVMYKVGEAGAITKSSLALKQLSLEPAGIAGYMRVTNKLLNNWQAASALLSNQLRLALIGFKDTQFYSGNGIAGPLGIINSPCRIDVARGTANTIVTADINNMYARIKMGGSFVWIASQTILPQLLTLRDAGSFNLFQTDYSKPMPNTLMGIPLMFNDRSVALGTRGDLVLADLKYYWVKRGSGPFIASDGGIVNFLTDETLIKIVDNVDGKPWLTAPLPLEGSTTNTVSPIVVLN